MKKPADLPRLQARARILGAIRLFFESRGYLEVTTPVRIPVPAPEAHIDAVPADGWFLQTSPELCMKRLLARGHERIYQICPCFRQHERGRRHLPELTLLEWYTAGVDYAHMMDQTTELVRQAARAVLETAPVIRGDMVVDLHQPWQRLTVREAFERYAACSMDGALADGRFDEVMGLEIEPHLGVEAPVILVDYPAACGALARPKPGAPDVVERFEVYIAGVELCNAFSELTDAGEQRRRFEAELARRRSAGRAVTPMPEPFLADLARMPEAAGNALGIDRLVMLLTGADIIDDVVTFTPETL